MTSCPSPTAVAAAATGAGEVPAGISDALDIVVAASRNDKDIVEGTGRWQESKNEGWDGMERVSLLTLAWTCFY